MMLQRPRWGRALFAGSAEDPQGGQTGRRGPGTGRSRETGPILATDAGRAGALRCGWESPRARRLPRSPSPPVAYSPVRDKSKAERGKSLVGRTCGRPRDRFVHISLTRTRHRRNHPAGRPAGAAARRTPNLRPHHDHLRARAGLGDGRSGSLRHVRATPRPARAVSRVGRHVQGQRAPGQLARIRRLSKTVLSPWWLQATRCSSVASVAPAVAAGRGRSFRKIMSLSRTALGLSPAWIERIPSRATSWASN